MRPIVRLLAHTPDPTRVMALAARLCYTQGLTIQDVDKGLTDDSAQKLVEKIISNKHHGVLEHAVFTFGIEGVSRDLTHQLVRHRNTSYDQQSLHYTIAREDFDMARPAGLDESQRERWDHLKSEAYLLYKDLVDNGTPREEARHILPGGIETKIICTANLRQWMHFVQIRACVVNQHEITVVAHLVKNELEKLMPYLKGYLGPTCLTEGVCYEGKKYCEAPWKIPCEVRGK